MATSLRQAAPRGFGWLARRGPTPPPYSPPPAPPPYVPGGGQPPRYGEGLPPDLVYPWDEPGKRRAGAPRRRRLPLGRIILGLLALLALAFAARLAIFLAVVSTEPLYTAHFWPIAGPREANVLIMGFGGAGHEGQYLTDSLLLLHADLPSRDTAQIAVPRDLWVRIPPGSDRYAKLNSAYSYGSEGGADPVAGGRLATTKVGEVTGLPGDRWVTIDFRGFRALVDALGGVDIEVERGFSSQYPANDDPAIDPNWTTVTFEAGRQHMDGETAIRYARARYADIPEEASDFARGQRQQRLVAAIGARLRHPAHWWRAFAVMNALQPALQTNLAPADLLILFLRADTSGGARIRIDDTNVLENATTSDGQAILQPRNGNYDLISGYIREQLK